MKTGALIGIAFAGLVVLGGMLMVGNWISYNNRDKVLRNLATAQIEVSKNTFDQMWKILQEQAGVTDQYKEAFSKIYPDLMAGRYGNERGGALLSMITESNPTFDTSLYAKLMESIEVQRTNFTAAQNRVVDVKLEHDNLIDTFPGSFFVSNKTRIEVPEVRSDRTKEAFETGVDNKTLFDKK